MKIHLFLAVLLALCRNLLADSKGMPKVVTRLTAEQLQSIGLAINFLENDRRVDLQASEELTHLSDRELYDLMDQWRTRTAVGSIAIGSSWVDEDGGFNMRNRVNLLNYDVTFGFETTSFSIACWAIGPTSDVYGNRSTSINYRARAASYSSVTLVSFNELGLDQSYNAWVATDELFVIGKGEDEENYSNALVIQKKCGCPVCWQCHCRRGVGGQSRRRYSDGHLRVIFCALRM